MSSNQVSWQSTDLDAMISNPTVAFRATEQVIREHSKTFYFATALLPHKARRAVRSLYAFCRATDDLVDAEDASLADIENWRAQTNLPPEKQAHPILYAWSLTRREYQVNPLYEQELIAGVCMDIQFKPYPTWEALQRYCYRVASTVGLLSMPIIGLAPGVTFEQAAPYAIRLGIALQLTNILRDVGEDNLRGRVYFPEEDLARFDLALEDIHRRVFDSRFINLMKFQIERARRLYAESLPGIALLSAATRPAVGAAALLYAAILDEIEALEYDVYNHRARTSGLRKLGLLPGILWKVAGLSPPPAG
ncbi:MAG: phytoene/squalene synthase family protein [Chloroflexota bacterium]